MSRWLVMPIIQEFSVEEWPTRPFDDKLDRRPPTPEEKNKMDREIVALGNLMRDSGVWWQLDGALNISLRAGDYYCIHRDVDISLLRDDVPKLEEYFLQRGCGLFKLAKTNKTRTLWRVGSAAFKGGEEMGELWQLRLVAIDESGAIRLDTDLPPIEVVVIEKNKQGHPLVWRYWKEVLLPEEWLRIETIDFKGVQINLSYPARFLFHKMWFNRGPSDNTDIRKFLELDLLRPEDVDVISQVADARIAAMEKIEKDDDKKDVPELKKLIFQRIRQFRASAEKKKKA